MLVLIKGAGDLASGVALRLRHAGFAVVMTEIAKPTSVRRTVCFSEAVYRRRAIVEDVEALLAGDPAQMGETLDAGKIPVFIDPVGRMVKELAPGVLVDAIMAKRNTGTKIDDAPVVIALGPGFTAGVDCHAVIETMRGHTLGRVIREGSALPNTGVPGEIGGFGSERLLRAPADGVFRALAGIGDTVEAGSIVAEVSGVPVRAEIKGIVRGILPDRITVHRGMKAGDIDPRCKREHCFSVSDKALAVAGGVLEALLCLTAKEVRRNFYF